MPRALVTGGAGFVGRHLTRRLLGQGYDVWIIDDLSAGRHADRWLGDAVERRTTGEIRTDYQLSSGRTVVFLKMDAMVAILQQLGVAGNTAEWEFPSFDLVVALASVVGGRKKIDGDPMEVAIDLGIDAALFLWAVRNRHKIGRLLYASSSAAYPINLQTATGHLALRESMIDFETGNLGQPDMTYGWSKLTGEYLARIAVRHYGMKVACVRPFSGYGEDQDVVYPVPAIALRAARRENPIQVWGSGEQGRDFIHIDDCITAMLLASERIEDGRGVNLGTGILTTFIEVANLFVRLEGYHGVVRPMIDQPIGVQSRYCDPSQMRSLLDFRPTISVEEGFARVLQFAHRRAEAGEDLILQGGN